MAPVSATRSLPASAGTERRRLLLLWCAALLWVAALAGLLALFEWVGEGAWPVVLLLYFPRHPWIVPGLLLLPFALRRGSRALLWPLAVGAAVWLFPVMGFVAPGHRPPPSAPTLRVLSYNTTHAVDGVESLRALVLETRADLVLFQWSSHLAHEAMSGPGFEGWAVLRVDQFTVASRFPVVSLEASGIPSGSGHPCAHAVLQAPIGTIDVYSIRPQSAREEIGATRKLGLRGRFAKLARDARSARLAEMASLREAQIRSIAETVAKAQHPVLIAGDSNLPDGSLLLRRHLGGFSDAFVESGWGFGYTHPARLPWMRLDRVLLGAGLRAVSFEILSRRASAHRPIVADIVRVPSG
jgi:endonuclease/exonuclease/phosphatase (EEP) superfamily protein YafD